MSKSIPIFLLLFNFYNCQAQTKISNTIVFVEQLLFTKEGEKNIELAHSKMIDSAQVSLKAKGWTQDSINSFLSIVKSYSLTELIKGNNLPNKTIINFSQDSIVWHIQNGEDVIGNYKVINFKDSIQYLVSKLDSTIVNKKQPFLGFVNTDEFEIKINKSDTKNIFGFDCFKMVLTKSKETDDGLSNFIDLSGNIIYEMYVTEDINLPTFLFEGGVKTIKNYFPLEIEVIDTSDSGMRAYYYVESFE